MALQHSLFIFISYARHDGRDLAVKLRESLLQAGHRVWLDNAEIDGGASWSHEIEDAISQCDITLALLSAGSYASEICRAEQIMSLDKGKRVIPLLVQQNAQRPIHLYARQYMSFADPSSYAASLAELLEAFYSPDAYADIAVPRKQIFTAPPLPLNFVPRIDELTKLRSAVLGDSTDHSVALSALHGMGGVGKSVLAAAMCHDPVIKAAFPDGIIWLSFGREITNVLPQMRELGKLLGDSEEYYTVDAVAVKRLREMVMERSLLIVLDDVWQVEHVEKFRFDASRCRVLFTTRDSSIALSMGADEVRLGTMTDAQSIDLLRTWARIDDPMLSNIVERVGNLPLALKLAGARLREGISAQEWLNTFQHVSQMKLGRRSIDPKENMEVCFDLSVQQLPEADRKLYHALGIFPEDAVIPQHTIIKLWRQIDSKLSEFDASELVTELSRLALIERDGEVMTVTLHDLLGDYTRGKLGRDEQKTHDALLLAYNPERRLWFEIPHDGYLYENLDYHLSAAGRMGELVLNAIDLRLIAAITASTNTLTAELFLALAASMTRERKGELAEFLRKIWQEYANMNHLLVRCLNLDEVAATMYTRLRHIDEFREHIAQLASIIAKPFLTAQDYPQAIPDLPTPGLLRTLQGHHQSIQACAWSPDGKWLASGSADSNVYIWDTATYVPVHLLQGHAATINACAWSPDSRFLVSASDDRTLKLWDVAEGELLRTLEGHTEKVESCDFSPDGHLVLSASLDQTLRVWDAKTGALAHTIQAHNKGINDCSWSPDGRYLISASSDRTAILWDATTQALIHILQGHRARVLCCAWSPNSHYVVTGGADKAVRVWNVEDGTERMSLEGSAEDINDCAWSPDGSLILGVSSDRTYRLWDARTGKLRVSHLAHTARVLGCTWSPDGQFVTTAATDRTLKIWAWDQEAAVDATAGSYWQLIRVVDAAYSPDGKRVVSAYEDRMLRLWDAETGVLLHTLRGHKGRVRACTWSPDGTKILSGSADSTLILWDAQTGNILSVLKGHKRGVRDCLFSPGGAMMISVSEDRTIKLWDASTLTAIRTINAHEKAIRACAWNRDGTQFVTAAEDHMLKIWRTDTGDLIRTIEAHTAWVRSVAWSADGKTLMSSGADHEIKLWNAKTGKLLRILEGHTDVASLCVWSPDGRYILSTGFDRTLRLWDAKTGGHLTTFYADGMMRACGFDPLNGSRAVATGDRGLYWLEIRD